MTFSPHDKTFKNLIISNIEFEKLRKREIFNYLSINHPFMPKFDGTTKESDSLIIKYIKGHTLINISKFFKFEKNRVFREKNNIR